MEQFTPEQVEIESDGEGTEHTLYIELPANGRFDITLTVQEEISDVSIIAMWEDSPLEPIEPVEPVEDNGVETFCEDEARTLFEEVDRNGDGVVDEREFISNDETDASDFATVDMNGDGEIEFREALQELCSCESELLIIASQISPFGEGVSVKEFATFDLKNKFDTSAFDTDKDGFLNGEELEIGSIICETTFDAFDGDGDGVPDDEDAFPEDPKESEDTDGDGVGDNSDLAPSVSNDLIYGSLGIVGAIVFALLILAFVGASRGQNGKSSNEWEEIKQQDIASQMLGLDDDSSIQEASTAPNESYVTEASEVTNNQAFAPQEPPSATEMASMDDFADLLESRPESNVSTPPQQLMGMLDATGAETIEYPAGSGVSWTRSSPTEPWHQR
jgi:hypothetical protein